MKIKFIAISALFLLISGLIGYATGFLIEQESYKHCFEGFPIAMLSQNIMAINTYEKSPKYFETNIINNTNGLSSELLCSYPTLSRRNKFRTRYMFRQVNSSSIMKSDDSAYNQQMFKFRAYVSANKSAPRAMCYKSIRD